MEAARTWIMVPDGYPLDGYPYLEARGPPA